MDKETAVLKIRPQDQAESHAQPVQSMQSQPETPAASMKRFLVPALLIILIIFVVFVVYLLANLPDTSFNDAPPLAGSSTTPTAALTLVPSQANSLTPTPANAGKPVIYPPYADEHDISSVNEAFSMNPDNPYWGFVHPGIDFMIIKDSIPVVASVSGTIVNLEITKDPGIMGWHAGFAIEYNNEYSICYNLETFGSTDQVEQDLRANVFIENGDRVQIGERIANLIKGGDGAHIDFGVCTAGTRVCPEPFFTEEALVSVLRLIQKTHPDWPVCDE